MSFRKKGAPLGAVEGQSIRFFFRIYFEFWLVELYSENYISEIYKLELKQFVSSAKELQDNKQNNSILLERQGENNFITEELRNLQNLSTWINKVFSFHCLSIDDVKEFKRRFEYEDNVSRHNENTDFIEEYRGVLRERSKSELVTVFQQKFQDVSNEVLLYFLVVMYLDLLRTEDFLRNKHHLETPELPLSISVEQKKQEKKKRPDGLGDNYTACHYMLYHYILQEVGMEEWFPPREKGKKFQRLQNVYGLSAPNLKKHYNPIFVSDGKRGYRNEDADAVKEMIIENRMPEKVLNKFEELTKNRFL